MGIVRNPISSFILIVLICFQISCDALETGTVLHRTLRKLKFRVSEISEIYPARLERYDALFLQDLNKALTETEIKDIQDFVNTGGTLIVVGDDPGLDGLFNVYGLKLHEFPEKQEFSRRITDEPFFPLHSVDVIRARTRFMLEPMVSEVVALYGTEDGATVVTLRHGEGRVFFIASAYLFSRDGLKYDEGNATFLYNLMSTLPRNAQVGLAEKRYYTLETRPPNPFAALVFGTRGGLGAVYICLILFVFLTLRGRRFGKPLDVQERSRRLSSEYVHAMTALYQKGNTRSEILRHIRDKFRSDLGNRWRVNPNLDTSAFLAELTQRGAVDEDEELAHLVTDLEPSSDISEAQLLDIAKRVDACREEANIGKTRLAVHRNL
ncbi:MAG: hypothetical protein OXD49_00480 [Candidatus Poribacteria bacterium]|nr:hypothetical protein [Candidatus Poribacteria bacterium]